MALAKAKIDAHKMELTPAKPKHSASHKSIPEIKGRDIVIIGLQPWYYEIGSNCKSIAAHFAEHNRVLYVNLPLNRKTYLSKNKNKGVQQHFDIIKNGSEKIRQIKNTMWEFYPDTIVESINKLPSTNAFKAVNYFNNRRLAKNIKSALKELDFKDVILFNDNDIFNGYNLKKLLSPAMYIYYMRDFLQGYDYWEKHCTTLEPQLIKKADVVVANSTYYATYCSQYNSNSYYIGQGCDLRLFDVSKKQIVPEEMKKFSSPVIGYSGYLDSVRLDENILMLIAQAHPEWNIVLVGPQDDFFTNSKLHQIPNVHFLGRKSMEELSAYVNSFDICINPQLQNQITKGNYPLKIDEYLAMGKPVVATRTKAMKLFETHTYLADKPEEYVSLIEKALAENNNAKQKERIEFAQSHSWENSMTELYKAMTKFISKPIKS
jgi:teichuronic acid biosynthesis glycosyltransferase TuaH